MIVTLTVLALPRLALARECTEPPCGGVDNFTGMNMYAWTFQDGGNHLCDGMFVRSSLLVIQLILASQSGTLVGVGTRT
jgi:hypothetical protein